MESGLSDQLESFRAARRNLEASVLPLATSVDGRRFSFQASLHGLQLQVGGYAVLEGDGLPRLGQVFNLELDRLNTELMLPTHAGGAQENRTEIPIRYARGEGTILEGDSAPFHDAQVRAATGPEVQAWLERSARHDAKLRLGELALTADVPGLADAGGFNRHTFLCGQSGSGKTYSLGVILEQLLTETDLRIVVLDPNSDFVRLGEVRGGVDPAVAERYQKAARGVAVYSADTPGNGGCGCMRSTSIRPPRPRRSAWTRSRTVRSITRWVSSWPAKGSSGSRNWQKAAPRTTPRTTVYSCVSATWASTATGYGRVLRRVRSSTRSMIRTCGV
jgi:hypothetical protein